jgi:hypothetical protein
VRDLEQKYPDSLIAIGVHSGKYRAERETDRIREAALRLGNTHPIVNDRQFRIWRSYAVSAWPTLAIIDPRGRVLITRAGEFTAAMVAPLIERMVGLYGSDGSLVRGISHFTPDASAIIPTTFRYPGKVAVHGRRIAVSDSGHHRVIVARLAASGTEAVIERVIGRGAPGFEDGVGGGFDGPQGLTFDQRPGHENQLYVTDAENHAIRAVDLNTGAIRTIGGTGHQLRTREDQRAGAMSSPWDVTQVGDVLYIAMAGIHQLWSLDLASHAVRVQSGTMREDIADGPHAAAALAQPMGIVSDGTRLYFVDAESSAVRWSELDPSGSVGTIVGTGLFDFGDRDGSGDAVLMQHQQGIARHADGRLLIADSYNDALKWVDPATRSATTWVRGFHEPGGVACGERHAYVADTNAHRILAVEYESGESQEVTFI